MKARGRKEPFAVADPLAGCGTAEAPSKAAIDLANLDHCEIDVIPSICVAKGNHHLADQPKEMTDVMDEWRCAVARI